ncbi:hypothetical protein G7B40_039100 [Aetokthonos hydrillicola Thurmond2011]|uniref:Uncharacterized protein n=1 Tax=Aetokthonos hydrillicola Thurmond2011 TaxID=2712845 RepID=A0AAP5ME45_9CYAN|nr:hypothetical protein [Aetokthonos hydrillicola]MDR9900513.1 hypothetical protein [Aetokthonos hydrillicola Thurmond2011]
MNSFRYVVGQSVDFALHLDGWASSSQEYIYLYFEGQTENVRNTSFGDCISKIQFLINLLTQPELGFTINDFRGVVDEQGIVQAIAVIQDVQLYDEGRRFPAIAIESICNAPWNVIDKTQVQTRKGAPTSLIEFIVKESQSKQFAGVVKLFTIPRAKLRYSKIGFIDTDGSGEMLLTQAACEEFLRRQQQRRDSQTFD